jgi:hypothetical protein
MRQPLQSAGPGPLAPLGFLTGKAGVDGGLQAVGGEARASLHQVESSPALGEAIPREALRLLLLEGGGVAFPGGERLHPQQPAELKLLTARLRGAASVRLDYAADGYLAEVAPLLSLLDELRLTLWLPRLGEELGHRVVLRDEAAFRAWIDEAKPGKLRVVHRADGFELQSNMGKLAGVDPNGPSVPARGGKDDVATLRRGLERLKERFTTAADVCFVPSFGMELRRVAEAMSGAYAPTSSEARGELLFEQLCLVYPRPKPSAAPAHVRDGGGG